MYNQENQMDVETAQTHIEKVMMGLNAKKTESERRMYILGAIDTMADFGIISEETRRDLYPRYEMQE